MSNLGVSALTTSAIAAVKTLSVRKAFIQAMATSQNPPHTLIQVDACMSERHSIDAPPSQFPIESGQLITENFIIKPFELEMEGVISDDPVNPLSSAVTSALSTFLPPAGIVAGGAAYAAFNALSSSPSPSVANFNQFLKILTTKLPVNVYTTLNFYKSMWLSHIDVDRTAQTGNILSFKVHFIQVILVQPQTVNVSKYSSPSLSSGQANLGKETTQASNVIGAQLNAGRVSGVTYGNAAVSQ